MYWRRMNATAPSWIVSGDVLHRLRCPVSRRQHVARQVEREQDRGDARDRDDPLERAGIHQRFDGPPCAVDLGRVREAATAGACPVGPAGRGGSGLRPKWGRGALTAGECNSRRNGGSNCIAGGVYAVRGAGRRPEVARPAPGRRPILPLLWISPCWPSPAPSPSPPWSRCRRETGASRRSGSSAALALGPLVAEPLPDPLAVGGPDRAAALAGYLLRVACARPRPPAARGWAGRPRPRRRRGLRGRHRRPRVRGRRRRTRRGGRRGVRARGPGRGAPDRRPRHDPARLRAPAGGRGGGPDAGRVRRHAERARGARRGRRRRGGRLGGRAPGDVV